MRMRAALVLSALLIVANADALLGQGFQGGLRGAIKDAGGVIPGVEVTLTNEQTNIKRSTATNERGEYVFASVDPGNYAVKAILQGYKTVDRGEIVTVPADSTLKESTNDCVPRRNPTPS